MATVAYELERFAPSGKKKPVVRVARGTRRTRAERGFKMFGNLLMVAVVVTLAVGVLYTQARLNEVTGQIAEQKKELADQQAMYAWLTFEMQNASNIKDIEEKARALGMVKMNKNQVVHIQVEEGERIQVRESGLSQMLEQAGTGLLSVVDHLGP